MNLFNPPKTFRIFKNENDYGAIYFNHLGQEMIKSPPYAFNSLENARAHVNELIEFLQKEDYIFTTSAFNYTVNGHDIFGSDSLTQQEQKEFIPYLKEWVSKVTIEEV